MWYRSVWRGSRLAGSGRALGLLLAAWVSALAIAPATAEDSAVVLLYRAVGPDAGINHTAIADFELHLAHLVENNYSVQPLASVIAAMRGSGQSLLDRTVALTFDMGDISVYREAWPRLKAAGLPMTVFVATEQIDSAGAGQMSWADLREMAAAGATIGLHGARYSRVVGRDPAAVVQEVKRARQRVIDEIGAPPSLFAYPYGEYSAAVMRALTGESGAGIDAAFGQHSGVVHRGSDFLALPRFSMSGEFAAFDRFRIAVDALPLPVSDLVPIDPVVEQNPPAVGFTLAEELGSSATLSCFASEAGKLSIERLGERRVELRLPGPVQAKRLRINCTMPAREGRWRWLGLQYLIPAQ